MDETVLIYLTPQQAKHYVMMQFLASVGMFDVKSGQVVINFDELGQIRDVGITHHFKAKKEVFDYPIDSKT